MQCDYFDAGRCRSCTLMGTPYDAQVAQLQANVADVLAPVVPAEVWQPPVTGPESGFRNKAKLVVGGTAGSPTFGILDGDRRGVDLRHCGLYEPGLHHAVKQVAAWVAELGLTPYDVPRRSGELKHVIITNSPDAEQLVRLVLRSPGQIGRVQRGLGDLRASLPSARVVSVNLLPGHQALLEGNEEHLLTDESTLAMRVNGITLQLRPRSFFQTNTTVAAALYQEASVWAAQVDPRSVVDLYCGVGGFALHLARALPRAGDVLGVELAHDAVIGARFASATAGLRARFEVGDAVTALTSAAAHDAPELVVLNPPRRGIGPELAGWVEGSRVQHVLYSSCNAASLGEDLARMPSMRATTARMFAMFPQTLHHEVLVLLVRG